MIIDSGIVTGSLQVSGSFSVQGNTILAGGLDVVGGITGSISGSSATAVSASYADTAINAPYYVTTASYNADSASVSTRVTNLESWSSSLDINYATDAQLNASASALQAGVTASIAGFATTGSNTFTGTQTINGGLNVIGGITGSISGSSATAVSASYADTSLNWLSSSFYVPYTGSTTDVRLGLNDLYADNIISTYPGFGVLAALSRDVSGPGFGVLNLKYGISNGFLKPTTLSSDKNWTLPDKSGTVALLSDTFPYTGSAIVSGSLEVIGSLDATVVSASYIQALSASIEYLSVIYQTSSVVYSSGSNQFGDSPADTQTLYGTVDIKNGPVLVTGSMGVSGTSTATSGSFGHLYADFTKSKFIYASGSSQLGNAANDYQAIFGTVDIINGPVLVTGSLNVASRITAGELTVLYGITGSINGTASYVEVAQTASLALLAELATSASHADVSNVTTTASYALQAQNSFTASLAATALNANTASYVELAESASYVQVAQTASYVTLAQTASYVLQAQNAFSASLAATAQTANTASYVELAQSASYVLQAQNAYSASTAILANTASYILTAQSASHAAYAEIATTAYTASSAANNFVVNGIMGVGGAANGLYQVYVTTSIEDGTLALDSSADYNAMYFLKGGLKKFEISTAGNGTPITQLIPYTSSGFFQIGNPSNASNDMIFLSEPTGGRVILGPGIATGSTSLSGSQQTDLVQFTGNTFVSGALTVLGAQYTYGPIQAFSGVTGSLNGNAATADTATSAPYYVTTASYNADSGSISTRVTNLENWSSSLDSGFVNNAELNAATASLQAGVSASIDIATGSLQTGVSASIDIATGSLQIGVSASIDIATGSLQSGVTASINIATGSLQAGVTASINALSSSIAPQIANLEVTASDLTTASSSFSTRVSTIEGTYVTTGSNTFAGTQYISDTSNAISFTSTASLYTDGGLRVSKNAFVSGNLDVAGNFTIFGTASISYVTTSVFVGLEFIDLNTDLPALRYAGINVGDSGSTGLSSSFWYDSTKDNWLYVYSNAISEQTSSQAINGPITYNDLGNEQGLTANYITKAQLTGPGNNHHITSSQIIDDGTTVAIAGNLQVTGSLYAGNLTGSLNGSNLVAGSVGNDRLTNSAITIAGTSTSLGGSIAATTILSGTGVFSGSAQIPSASITNTQLVNNAVTVTAGTGLSGGGPVALGSSVTLSNAGVTSIVAGTGVTASSATGAVTVSIGQAVNVGSNVSFGNITSTNQFVTVSSGQAALNLSGSATVGGSTFFDFIRATNTAGGSTNINKTIRINATGAMEWVNSAYSTVILTLTDAGALTAAADVTAFSDARLKENVNTITGALEKVGRLRGVTYNRIDLEDKSEKLGFIAQEVLEVIPQVVLGSEEETYSVAYGNITALHNEAIKELKAEIEELKGIINTLINK